RLKEILGHPFSGEVNTADYASYARHTNGEPYKAEEWPITRSMKGEVVANEEMEWRQADGRRVFLSVNSAPIQPKTGNIVGVVATFFDLTYRRSGEEMLRLSEQMTATGRLAAALAHEINNPLAAVTNAVYLLSEDKSLSEEARKYSNAADMELKRIAHITHSLLGLYRRTVAPEEFHIHEVLDEVLELYEAKIAANKIRVVKRYDYDGKMHGSSTEVRQIFLNLIGNAIEAAGRNAVLGLHISASRDWRNFGVSGIRICVADNGPGIIPEDRRRIFEPFFTTKDQKGTGLGLWVSRGIVNKYGGEIRARSSTIPGKSGTFFSIFFPAHVERKPRKSNAKDRQEAPHGAQGADVAEA
ncbi:MAG TPA: ATP-binding protein, partial [Candidatus Limnocylindrales bacterium]|nr:ATP-binding protein [Candidatus Limnocylindrales bacterium]